MERIYKYLSLPLLNILTNVPLELKEKISEIRVRAGGFLSVSTYEKNIVLGADSKPIKNTKDAYICTSDDVSATISRMTEGSVYRYMKSLSQGYVVTRDGIRVGVIGRMVGDENGRDAITDFSGINVRLPKEIASSGDKILKKLRENPDKSILIYSPPGYGKTTVIRSVAQGLSTAKRVSVIDEKGEILPNGAIGMIDRLIGYPKPLGIEIAVRLFSPEYVICDEIGLGDDTEAILSVQNSGVPFIATAHGGTIEEICRKPNIYKLIRENVFDYFAKITKENGRAVVSFEELLE